MSNIRINNSDISGINNFTDNSNIIIDGKRVTTKPSVLEVLEELQNNRSKYVTNYGFNKLVPPHWIFQCFIEEWNKIVVEEVLPIKITFGLYHEEDYRPHCKRVITTIGITKILDTVFGNEPIIIEGLDKHVKPILIKMFRDALLNPIFSHVRMMKMLPELSMKDTTIDIKVIGLHHETAIEIDGDFNNHIIFDYMME